MTRVGLFIIDQMERVEVFIVHFDGLHHIRELDLKVLIRNKFLLTDGASLLLSIKPVVDTDCVEIVETAE